MAITFERVEVYAGHGQSTTNITLPSHGTLGGPEEGDLMLILVGARSGTGDGDVASAPGWELVESRVGVSYQTTTLKRVATSDDAGKQVAVSVPNNNTAAIQYLRFSKESDHMAWRVEAREDGGSSQSDVRVTVPDVNLSVSGVVVAFSFMAAGNQGWWNEYSQYDNTLGGYPQEITQGSSSQGSGYRRRISIMDKDGVQGVGAGPDGIPEIIGDFPPPTPPSNLRLRSKTHRSVAVRWDAAESEGIIDGYQIFRGSLHVATVNGVTLSSTIRGLSGNSNYTFRVRAIDIREQVGPFSNQITVRTDREPEEEEEDTPPPSAPSGPNAPSRITNVTLVGRSQTGLRFRWSTPTAGGPVSRFRTQRSGASSGTQATHTARERRFGGLSAGTRYTFAFRAEGPGGAGPWVNASATTSSPPAPKTYSKTYSANWSQAYRSNGGLHTGGSYLFHGYGDSFNGNGRSLIGFNDAAIRRDLNGARVLSCHFRITIHDTWWNAGGRFRYGYHNRSSRPGSWSSGMVTMRGTSGNVTGGQRVTINLGSAVGNRFKSGSARGVCIGPASSNSTNYYMRIRRHNQSGSPQLVIRYEK